MGSSLLESGFLNKDKALPQGFSPNNGEYQQNILENLHHMSSHFMESSTRATQMKNLQKTDTFSQIEINKYLKSLNQIKF